VAIPHFFEIATSPSLLAMTIKEAEREGFEPSEAGNPTSSQ